MDYASSNVPMFSGPQHTVNFKLNLRSFVFQLNMTRKCMPTRRCMQCARDRRLVVQFVVVSNSVVPESHATIMITQKAKFGS